MMVLKVIKVMMLILVITSESVNSPISSIFLMNLQTKQHFHYELLAFVTRKE